MLNTILVYFGKVIIQQLNLEKSKKYSLASQ
jgi:hypothetical protein